MGRLTKDAAQTGSKFPWALLEEATKGVRASNEMVARTPIYSDTDGSSEQQMRLLAQEISMREPGSTVFLCQEDDFHHGDALTPLISEQATVFKNGSELASDTVVTKEPTLPNSEASAWAAVKDAPWKPGTDKAAHWREAFLEATVAREPTEGGLDVATAGEEHLTPLPMPHRLRDILASHPVVLLLGERTGLSPEQGRILQEKQRETLVVLQRGLGRQANSFKTVHVDCAPELKQELEELSSKQQQPLMLPQLYVEGRRVVGHQFICVTKGFQVEVAVRTLLWVVTSVTAGLLSWLLQLIITWRQLHVGCLEYSGGASKKQIFVSFISLAMAYWIPVDIVRWIVETAICMHAWVSFSQAATSRPLLHVVIVSALLFAGYEVVRRFVAMPLMRSIDKLIAAALELCIPKVRTMNHFCYEAKGLTEWNEELLSACQGGRQGWKMPQWMRMWLQG